MVNNERQIGGLIPKTGSLRKSWTYTRRRVIDCVFAIQKALTIDDSWVSHIPLWSFIPVLFSQALTLEGWGTVTMSIGCQHKGRPPCAHPPLQTSKLETSLSWVKGVSFRWDRSLGTATNSKGHRLLAGMGCQIPRGALRGTPSAGFWRTLFCSLVVVLVALFSDRLGVVHLLFCEFPQAGSSSAPAVVHFMTPLS